jgi:hypothetical protein
VRFKHSVLFNRLGHLCARVGRTVGQSLKHDGSLDTRASDSLSRRHSLSITSGGASARHVHPLPSPGFAPAAHCPLDGVLSQLPPDVLMTSQFQLPPTRGSRRADSVQLLALAETKTSPLYATQSYLAFGDDEWMNQEKVGGRKGHMGKVGERWCCGVEWGPVRA